MKGVVGTGETNIQFVEQTYVSSEFERPSWTLCREIIRLKGTSL